MFLYGILTLLFTVIEFISILVRVFAWDDNYKRDSKPFLSLFKGFDLIQIIFFTGLPIILIEIGMIYFLECIINPERHRENILNAPLFKTKKRDDN